MPESDISNFRLVFHIGAGKTGTSSIQESLRGSSDSLREGGYDYWGLMLERAPIQKYSWQKASRTKEFLALSHADAVAQVSDVLISSCEACKQSGLGGAVWSNEWFFGRHHSVIPALKQLETRGVEVEIVAYIRRHDDWARSAYLQWGIKHKSYPGTLRPFKQYNKDRPVRFAGALKPWESAFRDTFKLRNFDAVKDVVADFVSAAKLPIDLPVVRVNESPSHIELLLRALYNNLVEGEALPVEFDRQFQLDAIKGPMNPIEWINNLLPGEEDLRKVAEEASEDCKILNEMLKREGQDEITFTNKERLYSIDFSAEEMCSILFQIIFLQSKKMQRMQSQLNGIIKQNKRQSPDANFDD